MKLILKKESIILFGSFIAGLGSMLFMPTPFGRVAIFDLGCYFAFFLLIGKWSTLSKPQRTIVYISLIWVLSAILSNIMNDVPAQVNFKSSMIVFNVTCMLGCSFILLNRSPKAFTWFIVGNGISGILSFYILPNGALLYYAESAGYAGGNMANFLLEKQVYPVYADAVVKSILFPLASSTQFAMLLINSIILGSGFFLLTAGSRSSFGVFAAASLFGFAYQVSRKVVEKVLRRIFLTLLIILAGGYILIETYAFFAKTGRLGMAEKQKYERQFLESGLGFFGGRSDILYFGQLLVKSPVFGAGAERIDRWGVVEEVQKKYGITDSLWSPNKKIPGHSIIIGSWVQNGVGGGIFWTYVIIIIMQFLRKGIINYPRYLPIILYLYLSFLWAILFSPFGGSRGLFCLLIANAVIINEEQRASII